MTDVAALIPLLPLLAFTIIAFGGARMNSMAHRVGIPCLALAFGCSLLALKEVQAHGAFTLAGHRFIHVGEVQVSLALYVDQLTVLLLLLVTGVSWIVHVYSSRYMEGDRRYRRFFAVIALFTFSMIMVVMSANLLMLYMFWEIMGICSYLLISHYSERLSACRAATKAFLVNAVASVGMGFGVILAFATFGTFDIHTILERAPDLGNRTINLLAWAGLEWSVSVVTVIALFLFMGPIGKSSQFPLHIWLPFAMEAPTPVSALIHAATMVNAGVFLVARMSPLFLESSVAMAVVAAVGATTALFGGCLALVHSDIKKILAYSTMSQIGYMIFACGVGAFAIAIFHLLAHGALKAFLFLSTGNVVRQLEGGHDAGEEAMGTAPAQSGTIPLGALLFALIPPVVIFSSPYERLWTTTASVPAQWTFWIIGLLTVFLTAWYVFRGMIECLAPPRFVFDAPGKEARPKSWVSPAVLTLLGLGGLVSIGILVWSWSWIGNFLSPVFAVTAQDVEASDRGLPIVLIVAFVIAVAGWGLAYAFHRTAARRTAAHFQQKLYVFFLHKGYIDDLYEVGVVNPTVRFSGWLWRVVDVGGIDRLVTGMGSMTVSAARWIWQVIDLQGIDRTIKSLGRSSILLARWLWRVVDLGGIDQTVTNLGTKSQGLGRWLWRRVDIRGVERGIERVGTGAEETGEALQELEPRMLQHHLLVLLFWLVLVMAVVFWLIF